LQFLAALPRLSGRIRRGARRDIRTMTGVPEYVRQGLSVAIGARNDCR
jgi:hypothetical protein